MNPTSPTNSMATTATFLLGFACLYGLLAVLAEFDATGRYGLAILAAMLVAAVVVERLLQPAGLAATLRALGLGRPALPAVAVAAGVAALVLAVYPVVTRLTGATFTLKAGWPWLLLGTFAFHGLAEELVWRAYAFRRLRRGRSFGAAVLATMPLMAATHLIIVFRSGLVTGLAAMTVAAVTSLPLAHLFEAGGQTLWAPAVVHTAIDSFKLVDVATDATATFSLTLAAISLCAPLLALALPVSSAPGSSHAVLPQQ